MIFTRAFIWIPITILGFTHLLSAQDLFEAKYSVGDHFSAVEVKNSHEDVVMRFDTLQDRVLVFNFWMIECVGCVAELPYLNRIYEQYQANGDRIQFISVTASGGDRLENFLAEHPIDWDNVLSPVDFMGLNGYALFEVRCMPTTMVVGIDRKVKFIKCGILNEENAGDFLQVISDSVKKIER